MTSDRTVSPGDLLPDVLAVLADVLRVPQEKIDAEQTFQSLGFDSLLTDEFVAVLNARYGLELLPTELYDHPSPGAFARRLALEPGRTGGPDPDPAAARTGVPFRHRRARGPVRGVPPGCGGPRLCRRRRGPRDPARAAGGDPGL